MWAGYHAVGALIGSITNGVFDGRKPSCGSVMTCLFFAFIIWVDAEGIKRL
jgi:hypothetical protein